MTSVTITVSVGSTTVSGQFNVDNPVSKDHEARAAEKAFRAANTALKFWTWDSCSLADADPEPVITVS